MNKYACHNTGLCTRSVNVIIGLAPPSLFQDVIPKIDTTTSTVHRPKIHHYWKKLSRQPTWSKLWTCCRATSPTNLYNKVGFCINISCSDFQQLGQLCPVSFWFFPIVLSFLGSLCKIMSSTASEFWLKPANSNQMKQAINLKEPIADWLTN